jgi:hypothetical protein
MFLIEVSEVEEVSEVRTARTSIFPECGAASTSPLPTG